MLSNSDDLAKLGGALGKLPRVTVTARTARNELEAQTADMAFDVTNGKLLLEAFELRRGASGKGSSAKA